MDPNKEKFKARQSFIIFFFNLVAYSLDRILKRAVQNGVIAGIGCSEITKKAHCIQYANDTVILCDAKKLQITNLKFILYSFEVQVSDMFED